MVRLRQFFNLLKNSFLEFRKNDPLRMAAATSFFANFALPPILIILVEVFGFFGNRQAIRRNLVDQLGQAVDRNTMVQIRETLKNVHYLPLSPYMRVGGFLFLIFVATTLFSVITSSLNQLWGIRRKQGNGVTFILLYRIKTIGVIMLTGVLFFIVLFGDAHSTILQHQANEMGRTTGVFFSKVFFHGLSMIAGIAWFTIVFRFVADGRPVWRTALAGGLLTGLMFTLGKILLHLVLTFGHVQTIYGSSTSIVLLLLFIFYASFIFYFGATFTRMVALARGQQIVPTEHAVQVINLLM